MHTPETEQKQLHKQSRETQKHLHEKTRRIAKYEVFLKNLYFLKYFPRKLTLQEALIIHDNILELGNSNHTFHADQLLLLLLDKIKMSDYNCRNVLLCKHSESADDDDSDDDEYEILVLLMDSLLALLHCSDNFLRQYLYQKLTTAQLAVPLVIPDPITGTLEFPLWAMRSIVKYWRCRVSETRASESYHEGRIVDCEAPLISFMRFSHPEKYSKSYILNKVMSQISRPIHHFFFNHECEGSSVERKFVDGIIEACWYLPSGKESDIFNDAITFANLRGNAGNLKNSEQLAFLSFHSYMSFIFLNEQDIDTHSECIQKLNSAKGKVFFLMNNCTKSEEEKHLFKNV